MIRILDYGTMCQVEKSTLAGQLNGDRKQISAPAEEVVELVNWLAPEYRTVVVPGPR